MPVIPQSHRHLRLDAFVDDKSQRNAAEFGSTWSARITLAAYPDAARIPSGVSIGWDARICDSGSPEASFSIINSTGIRVPRMTVYPS